MVIVRIRVSGMVDDSVNRLWIGRTGLGGGFVMES